MSPDDGHEDNRSAEQNTERPQLNEQDTMGKQMWRFYRYPKYTDMTIECNGKSWHTHRNTIAAQSTVFNAMLEGNFAESSSCRINLPDDDPILIECVIQFLYTRAYGYTPDATTPPDIISGGKCIHKALENLWGATVAKDHAKIYALADKYGIPTLMANAKNRYWATLITRDDQKTALREYFDSIEDVYTLTPPSNRGLREIAIHFIFSRHRRIEKLQKEDEELSALQRQTMIEYPEFASDLVVKLMSKAIIEPICEKCAKLEREGQESRTLEGEVIQCLCVKCRTKMFCHRH